MKVVIQKCLESSVIVEGKIINSIKKGYMILAGFTHDDNEEDIAYLVKKYQN